jgi:hypothetical protein
MRLDERHCRRGNHWLLVNRFDHGRILTEGVAQALNEREFFNERKRLKWSIRMLQKE